MKRNRIIKLLFLILMFFAFQGCVEDKTVDITVMPPITNEGLNTFGCLVDGWLFVGGRFQPVSAFYDIKKNIFCLTAYANRERIDLTQHSPVLCNPVPISLAEYFSGSGLSVKATNSGQIYFTSFNIMRGIASGTFRFDADYENNYQSEYGEVRITEGRFDVSFKIINRD